MIWNYTIHQGLPQGGKLPPCPPPPQKNPGFHKFGRITPLATNKITILGTIAGYKIISHCWLLSCRCMHSCSRSRLVGLVCSVYTLSHQLLYSHQALTLHTCWNDTVKKLFSMHVHNPGFCSAAKYNLQVTYKLYPEHKLKSLYCIYMGWNMLKQSM